MVKAEKEYDAWAVRELLLASFTAESLRRLLQYSDTPGLRLLANEITPASGLGAMVDTVIVHCQNLTLLSDLLVEVRLANPRQYARFEPHLLLGAKEPSNGLQTAKRDLAAADVRRSNLRQRDLGGADLHGVDLRSTDLSEANLCGADMRCAELRSANLKGADLSGANLQGADLRGSDLRSTDLRGGRSDLGQSVWGAPERQHAD